MLTQMIRNLCSIFQWKKPFKYIGGGLNKVSNKLYFFDTIGNYTYCLRKRLGF